MNSKRVKIFTIILISVFFCFLFSSCGLFVKKYLLCYKLSKGNLLSYYMNVENSVSSDIPNPRQTEENMKVTAVIKADFLQKVIDIDKDKREVFKNLLEDKKENN